MADWDWLKQIEIPGLTGAIGIVGTILTVRSRAKSDKDTAQLNFDASAASTLTDRFKALMDGYEGRISDLTHDLKETRERVTNLERHARLRNTICNDCENFRRYMKDHPDAFASS